MRIKLLDRLRDGAATVGELTEALGASQQNVSKHLGVLLQAGMVGRDEARQLVALRDRRREVFALCEQVCGGLRRQLGELDAMLKGRGDVHDPQRGAGWPLERVLFAMAGTVALVSALLAAAVSQWFLLLTAFVGVNQWLYVAVGACPASLVVRRVFRPALGRLPARRTPDDPLGPIGRLGRWTATHFRSVLSPGSSWPSALGIFAPRVEHALSGAGWEATGSESVQARELVDSDFARPRQLRR